MPEPPTESILADDSVPGMFGFFREIGVRETLESFIVAIILALLFRAYEAEAFIIPTGSMAPSLNGQHLDLECANCNWRYHSGASSEAEAGGDRVVSTQCPICQFKTDLDSRRNNDHISNNGDRILVNKFIYDFVEPERFEVIVFKNPNNGKQNYIKRLIGLPGDNILIENGDIYLMELMDDGTWKKEIARKPPRKLRHILQTVDDSHYIGRYLKDVNWPSRWQSFGEVNGWEIIEAGDHATFNSPQEGESWLRYRHFQPRREEWDSIGNGVTPVRFRDPDNLPAGEIIGDRYGYNASLHQRQVEFRPGDTRMTVEQPVEVDRGLHWVGDIGLKCWVDVKSSQGELLLDVVEGGAHFTCSIDVATGKATLVCDDTQVDTKVTFRDKAGDKVDSPTAQTNLKGAGSYRIEFVNADDQIHLWINNRYIEFDAATYDRAGVPLPQYSKLDPGDAEPLGVGAKDLELAVSRLKVVRDVYYTSFQGASNQGLDNEANLGFDEVAQMMAIQRDPASWNSSTAIAYFSAEKGKTEPMFELNDVDDPDKDQFLPMGDNSPKSLDGRVWDGPNYVERDMLIGRALFVYWPHTLNKPKYFPNFGEMGFIR